MKKLLLMLVVVVTATTYVQAQDKPVTFSIGAEGLLPVGDFNNTNNFGIGGTLQAEYKPADDLGLTLNSGYITFAGKNVGNFEYGSFAVIPVLGGVKYYFSPKVYGHGQLGVAFGTDKGDGSLFAYSPGIGFMLSQNVDVEAKYLGLSKNSSTAGSVGVRLAYNF